MGENVKSPLGVETQDLLDLSYEADSERNNVEDSLEEERQSILQFKDNVARAEARPFNKIMEQSEESFSQEDFENRKLETELEKTNKMIRKLRLLKERVPTISKKIKIPRSLKIQA